MCEFRDHPECLRSAREGQVRHRVDDRGYLIGSLKQGGPSDLVVYADGRWQLTDAGWNKLNEKLGALDLDGIPRWIEFCDQDVAHFRSGSAGPSKPAPKKPRPPKVKPVAHNHPLWPIAAAEYDRINNLPKVQRIKAGLRTKTDLRRHMRKVLKPHGTFKASTIWRWTKEKAPHGMPNK
jgi:hypothetical protein